jgi:hypothetical protein
MAKYQVLRPIEHDQKLFLPQGAPSPAAARSVSHGHEIAVDASGVIELSEQQAAAFANGQVALIPEAQGRGGAEPRKSKS